MAGTFSKMANIINNIICKSDQVKNNVDNHMRNNLEGYINEQPQILPTNNQTFIQKLGIKNVNSIRLFFVWSTKNGKVFKRV